MRGSLYCGSLQGLRFGTHVRIVSQGLRISSRARAGGVIASR